MLFALLIAVPPAIGVWLATLRVTGGTGRVLALVAGLVVGVALFAGVVALAEGGAAEETP